MIVRGVAMGEDEFEDVIKRLIDSKYPINNRTGSIERRKQIKRVRKWYYNAAARCVNGNEENNIIEEWLNESN